MCIHTLMLKTTSKRLNVAIAIGLPGGWNIIFGCSRQAYYKSENYAGGFRLIVSISLLGRAKAVALSVAGAPCFPRSCTRLTSG